MNLRRLFSLSVCVCVCVCDGIVICIRGSLCMGLASMGKLALYPAISERLGYKAICIG